MGLESIQGRPEGEEVYRLIAHAASLNREAARAFDAGQPELGVALLEKAEMLSSDVTEWVDEIESVEAAEFRDGFLGPRLIEHSPPRKWSERLNLQRFKQLGAGLSAGLTFGCVVSEI